MAYSTNTQVETALGLEAGTLTTAQDTMITALIVLVDGLIDQFTNGKLAGTENGLAMLSASATAHLFTNGIGEYYNKEWRNSLRDACRTLLQHKDYKRLVHIADSTTPYRTDED